MKDTPSTGPGGTREDPWRDWGGDGPTLHFAHGNGFPPETYRLLLDALTERFHVVSAAARPIWSVAPAESLHDWNELADDLRRELRSRHLNGVVGVGHSLGGVLSLLAAAREPALFSAVVAIDPVLFTGAMALVWGAMKRLGIGHRLAIARRARGRRSHWPDRDSVRESYRGKAIFRTWRRDVFEDYIRAGTDPAPDGGVRLRYPPAWEARIFEITPHDLWRSLRGVGVPVLILRGEHSDTFTDAARRRALRTLPHARAVVVPDTTHFLPMERPHEVAEEISELADGVTQTRR